MTSWDLGELARAAEGEIRGGAFPVKVEAVGTDTRSLPPSCLFVALRGPNFDGHTFARTAAQSGARAVMVDARGDAGLDGLGVPRLVVRDTLAALGALARFHRRALKRPVVAVTGSNGKTTTKEMTAAVLGSRGFVHRTEGNLNNLVGVPLTLLRWEDSAWAAVVEMGMNAPGEIATLTAMAEPDVGVVTNAGAAHLEGLGSVEAVGRAKGELYAGLAADAVAVINVDDEVMTRVAGRLLRGQRRLTFGRGQAADVRVLAARAERGGLSVDMQVLGARCEAQLPVPGPHNALNAAAAVAAGVALGLDTPAMLKALRGVTVPGSRLRLLTDLPRGINVLDDCYNANPQSMRAAFATLASLTSGRRVAVLGDMFELGSTAPALHEDVGRAAAQHGITQVLALGPNAERTAEGARAAGISARAYGDLAALLADLDEQVRSGDWILVKGSRGMRMERVVEHLKGAG